MKNRNASKELERVMSAFEEGLIEESDNEILLGASPGLVATASRIVDEALSEFGSHEAEIIPDNLDDRRRLLELVMGSRATLPIELRAAYSSQRDLSDERVSSLLLRLVKMGLLKKST